jgi:hypothetical protein
MSGNTKKGVTFNPWMEVTTGSKRNAYSRGSHNNRASRAELAQQFAQAGMQRSKNANSIAFVGAYNSVLTGMGAMRISPTVGNITNNLRKLSLSNKKGGKRHSTRRKSRK